MKVNIAIFVIILVRISMLQAFAGQRNEVSAHRRRSVDDNGSRFLDENYDRISGRLDPDPWFRNPHAVDGRSRMDGMHAFWWTPRMRDRPVGRDEDYQWMRSRFRPGRFSSFDNDDLIRPRGNTGGRDNVVAHSRRGGSYGVQGKPRRRGRGRNRGRRRFN